MSSRSSTPRTPDRGSEWFKRPGDWVLWARCRTPGAEHARLFDAIDMPGRASHSERDRVRRAQLICADCPVADKCAEFARAADASGVWGGLYFPVPHMGRAAKRPTR